MSESTNKNASVLCSLPITLLTISWVEFWRYLHAFQNFLVFALALFRFNGSENSSSANLSTTWRSLFDWIHRCVVWTHALTEKIRKKQRWRKSDLLNIYFLWTRDFQKPSILHLRRMARLVWVDRKSVATKFRGKASLNIKLWASTPVTWLFFFLLQKMHILTGSNILSIIQTILYFLLDR